MALGVEASRGYWEHVDRAVVANERVHAAFVGRWFGAKSMDRVRFLIAVLQERFDPFPSALPVLRRWRSMDLASRQMICHWHTQLSAELYQVSVPTINEHLSNIFDEDEVDATATIRKFRMVRSEGDREVSRLVDHYDLDVILAVGYRVRAHRGMQFRRWATERLRESGGTLGLAMPTSEPRGSLGEDRRSAA